MIVNFTPLSALSPGELSEAKQRSVFMLESTGSLVLSTGKAISPADVARLRQEAQVVKGPRQNLFG